MLARSCVKGAAMEKEKYLGIITKEVVSATEETNAVELSRLIRDKEIGAVVILKDDKVVGIVSERDLVTRILAENLPADKSYAKDCMTREVITVDFKEGLNKIYQTLCEIKFRHLLIMNGSKLVGITSRRDLLDALACKRR